MLDVSTLHRIGIWEDEGEVVGAATYETWLANAWFLTHPDYEHLKPEMLTYVEEYLADTGDDGRRYLRAYVNDFNAALEEIVVARGYRQEARFQHSMSQFEIPLPFPPMRLPAGFRVKSLGEENDLRKIHRGVHRDFDHPGEPPEEELAGREQNQSGSHFRKDLTVVIKVPSGDYVSYCGTWYDPINKFGYVEHVATDPDYRRRGLGRTAVLESIRRCGAQGATVAYVWTDMPFYLALGFKRLFMQNCWLKL